VNYGYSGKAKKKGSKATIVLAAAVGVAAGVAIGVGGYYAYQRYNENSRRRGYNDAGQAWGSGQYQSGMQRPSWCTVPAGKPNAGSMVQCSDCIRNYGSACRNQDSCYQGGGCSTTLPLDTVRDDLMGTGFTPDDFKSPLTVKIMEITGVEFTAKDTCPASNNATANMTAFIKASSFDTNLFFTLTEMDVLADPANGGGGGMCTRDTRSGCTSSNSCYSNEQCIVPPGGVGKFCYCKPGYCFQLKKCVRKGTANSAPFQAGITWVPIVAVLLCLRAFRFS